MSTFHVGKWLCRHFGSVSNITRDFRHILAGVGRITCDLRHISLSTTLSRRDKGWVGQHKHSAGPRAGTQKPPAFRLGASRFRGQPKSSYCREYPRLSVTKQNSTHNALYLQAQGGNRSHAQSCLIHRPVSYHFLTVVWLGVIELAVVTDHIILTLIAHILKLQFVTVQYLLIENRVIRVFANYRH